MNIIALSDIHGSIHYLPAIADDLSHADLVLIAGDITTFGGEPQAHKVLYAISDYNNQILAVHGNCDPPAVEEYLETHAVALHGKCVDFNGITFAGLGGAMHYNPGNRNGSPEDEFSSCLDGLRERMAGDRAVVLVTHQPAQGTRLDTVGPGKHAGSTAIREFIEETKPMLAISGHVHEAIAIDRLNGTVLVNPGPFKDGRFAKIEIEGNEVANMQICSVR